MKIGHAVLMNVVLPRRVWTASLIVVEVYRPSLQSFWGEVFVQIKGSLREEVRIIDGLCMSCNPESQREGGSHFDLQNGSICPEHKVEIITQSQVAHDRTREVLSRATTKD